VCTAGALAVQLRFACIRLTSVITKKRAASALFAMLSDRKVVETIAVSALEAIDLI
jgi:hypothetical protein